MSKKTESNVNGSIGYGQAYVVSNDIQDRLFGRIMSLFELLNLTEKQENSMRSLLNKEIYGILDDAISISSERHTEIRNLYYKKRQEANKDMLSMQAI